MTTTSSKPRQPNDHRPKADPRGTKRLRIGGRQRTLRFDNNALIELCEAAGKDDTQSVLEAAARLSPRAIRAMVWAGLLHDDPDLDVVDVGSWMGEGQGLVPLGDAMVAGIAALTSAIGDQSLDGDDGADGDGREGGDRPTRRGRGTGTSPSAPQLQPGSDLPSSGG